MRRLEPLPSLPARFSPCASPSGRGRRVDLGERMSTLLVALAAIGGFLLGRSRLACRHEWRRSQQTLLRVRRQWSCIHCGAVVQEFV